MKRVIARRTGAGTRRRRCRSAPRVDPQSVVNAAYAKYKDSQGRARTPTTFRRSPRSIPNLFGIALVTADGKVYTAGDIKTEVSIQSISKVFTMAQVIQEQGLDSIEKRIGVDATGARFNSIIAIEGVKTVSGTGAPEMNAAGQSRRDHAPPAWSRARPPTRSGTRSSAFHDDFAGRQLTVLQDVYKSESDTQPAQPGDRRADVRLRLHQDRLAAGGRSLHAPVLDRRQRQGSRR